MQRLLAAIMFSLAGNLAQAWDVQPYTASYHFNIDNKLSGTATRVLEKTGSDTYRYVFSASAPLASAQETSDFRFDGKQVMPLRYQQSRKIFMIGKQTTVNYDWARNMASSKRDKNSQQYALKPGTLDSLNLEVQIRRDLHDTGKLGSDYWLGDAKGLSPLKFEILGEEELDTPLGKLQTVKIQRHHSSADRHTTFWLAKDMDYIPAKVVQNDDGALYTIEISSFEAAK